MTTHETIKNVLENLNIPSQQIDVYLKLLELGEIGVGQLSITLNINRTTLYPILQKMEHKGLVSKIISNKTFKATHPKQLFENLQRNNLALHQILPLFSQIMTGDTKTTKVKFYSGSKGIQQMLMDELETFDQAKQKTLKVVGDSTAWYYYDSIFRKQYQKKRKDLGVQVKIILTNRSKNQKDMWDKMKMQGKFMPESYKFTGRISVSNKKIAIIALQDQNGIIIESPELANTFVQWFDFSWLMLK